MKVLKEDIMPDIQTDIVIPENEIEPEGPKQGIETGVANLIHDLIINENETIQQYNIAASNMIQYPELVKLMHDIAGEELVHVGELQKALEVVSPNEIKIAEGEQEAKEILYSDPLITESTSSKSDKSKVDTKIISDLEKTLKSSIEEYKNELGHDGFEFEAEFPDTYANRTAILDLFSKYDIYDWDVFEDSVTPFNGVDYRYWFLVLKPSSDFFDEWGADYGYKYE